MAFRYIPAVFFLVVLGAFCGAAHAVDPWWSPAPPIGPTYDSETIRVCAGDTVTLTVPGPFEDFDTYY